MTSWNTEVGVHNSQGSNKKRIKLDSVSNK